MARLNALLCTFLLLILTACSAGGGYNAKPWEPKPEVVQRPAEQTPEDLSVATVKQYPLDEARAAATANKQTDGLAPVKVAILLPLSGKHERLGQAMLNASQMALFDLGFDSFEILPKDTKGTPEGARAAAKSALQDGAKLVLGPLFSPSVRAAQQVTQSAGVNMIAFSTDWTLANQRTFLIGFLPFDQIERVTRYAVANGYGRIGVLSPQDNYGNGVVSAYNAISQNAGAQTTRVERIAANGNDLNKKLRQFTNYDARKNAQSKDAPFDAVLMPVGGALARQVGSFLNHYDLPPQSVKRLGTGLMDDPTLASDRTLDGAWFAAPAPKARTKFERRYSSIYYVKPPRIASLAYDATALSAILARMGLQKTGRPAFDHPSITNANGYSGIDGIFRFRPDGIVERGLAVLEYRRGNIVEIDPAPRTFQNRAF